MMRPLILAGLGAALTLLTPRTTMAQCPGCLPDLSCTVDPAFPALCPMQPPDATAGEYYETDITFWLPASFSEPGSGLTVDFEQMTVASISGLPFGLSIETSEPSGIYYPQENEYGCARICGIPLGAGTYTVTINIIAAVSVGGFPVNAPQSFALDLVVLPGSGTNTGFSFSPTSGCGSVEVNFQALIDASPQPTTWAWDFGNGNTSTVATPPSQTYDQPGTYDITLETTISNYVLNTVVLATVNDNWCGDVEEPLCNCGAPFIGTCPDLYFVLTDAGGATFTSSVVGGTTSATWNNLGLVLTNPPYNISFWDEDVVSQNDHLGTYNIPLSGIGTYNYNVAGGTTGNLVIGSQVVQQFNDADQVTVFPIPDVVLVQNETTGELCVEDTDLVGYQWLLDGVPQPGISGPCHSPATAGVWEVVGTNGFGCTANSNAVVVCPVFDIIWTNNVLSVPSGYTSYAWTFNGAPIPNSNAAFIFVQGDGTYTVTVDAGNGCTVVAEIEVSTVGVQEVGQLSARMGLYPVPSDGRFTVVAEGLRGNAVDVRLLDMAGRVVQERREPIVQGRLLTVMLVDAAPGAYLVHVTDNEHTLVGQVVLE